MRDVVGTRSAGEQAIVADAMEAAGQHVDEEAAMLRRGNAPVAAEICRRLAGLPNPHATTRGLISWSGAKRSMIGPVGGNNAKASYRESTRSVCNICQGM